MDEKKKKCNETAGLLLSGVAVQLRGALANIQGALENIVPPQAREGSDFVDQNAAILYQSYYRMLRLAGNLSDAARLGREELLPLDNGDIVALVGGICRRAEAVAALREQRLRFLCAEEEHITAYHEAAMEKVLLNLLSNAMKFTPKRGEIRVELLFEGGAVLLRVSDTGCGIPESLQESLFAPEICAERMEAAPYGLGLGLPICRHLVAGHDGEISLASTGPGGTSIQVSFPDRISTLARLRDFRFDSSGGFNRTLVGLSDALPARAFLKEYLD